jgi:hypothetical protein
MQPNSSSADETQIKPSSPWFRRARVGLALASLALSFIVAALWLESYHTSIEVRVRLISVRTYGVWSYPGLVGFSPLPGDGTGIPPGLSCSVRTLPSKLLRPLPHPLRPTLSIYPYSGPNHWQLSSPHWLLVLLLASAAVLLKPSPRTRCRLRELFAIVTLATVAFGGVAVLKGIRV